MTRSLENVFFFFYLALRKYHSHKGGWNRLGYKRQVTEYDITETLPGTFIYLISNRQKCRSVRVHRTTRKINKQIVLVFVNQCISSECLRYLYLTSYTIFVEYNINAFFIFLKIDILLLRNHYLFCSVYLHHL